jgi:hypothetical protein
MFLNIFGNLFVFVRRKEVERMAVIVKGKRTFDSVPETIKDQVKELLIDLELETLMGE